MAASTRTLLLTKAHKVLKKHYKAASPPSDRSLIEHLLFACCLENSEQAAAETVYGLLQQEFFDWNEVRVSTVRELSEVMAPLEDPEEAAHRLKSVLQSVFESVYAFDLEPLKKLNIGQAVKAIEAHAGTTSFSVSYVVQHALGGHSIPVNQGALEAFRLIGAISDTEAQQRKVPGLERAVPKSKGLEMGSLLHQLGVEVRRNPSGSAVRKILVEIAPECKDRLPKRPVKKKTAATKKDAGKKGAPAKTKAATKSGAPKTGAAKTGTAKRGAAAKTAKGEAAKAAAAKQPAKKQAAVKKKTSKAAKAHKQPKTAKAKKTTKTAKAGKKKPPVKKGAKKPAPAAAKRTTPKKTTSKVLSKRKPR